MALGLVRPLVHDRFDIIGDVHGELDALRSLLARLGCDVERARVERPLVFVGDVVDRGPDSVGALELVQHLVEEGAAQMILGNHELNLLLGSEKEGNGWFNPHARRPDGWNDRGAHVRFTSRQATPLERSNIRSFLSGLPLALESDRLRVVHAAWDRAAIEAARAARDLGALLRQRTAAAPANDLTGAPPMAALTDAATPLAFHPGLAAQQLFEQNSQPAKVITSGLERFIPAGNTPRFVNGRWRMLERDPWWEHDDDERSVVFGHYWRRRPGAKIEGKPDALSGTPPLAWFGAHRHAFCIDYSVGLRFKARQRDKDPHHDCALAALRFPEQVVVFDDTPERFPTSR